MKRSPLHRNKVLRSRRGRRREGWRSTIGFAFPRPQGRVYDDEYRALVLTLRCLLSDDPTHVCDSRTTGDHGGKRPLGRKSDDDEEIPFCYSAHRERQTATGWCKGVNRWAMRMILTTAIAETRARLGRKEAA